MHVSVNDCGDNVQECVHAHARACVCVCCVPGGGGGRGENLLPLVASHSCCCGHSILYPPLEAHLIVMRTTRRLWEAGGREKTENMGRQRNLGEGRRRRRNILEAHTRSTWRPNADPIGALPTQVCTCLPTARRRVDTRGGGPDGLQARAARVSQSCARSRRLRTSR